MAAADLSHRFPGIELHHIYDSRIPTIGVGEGTTPPFRHWLHEIVDVSFSELQRRCNVTRKDGIRFENWGSASSQYFHFFSPADGDYAYHISADKIVKLLAEHVNARTLDAKVVAVKSNGTQSVLQLEDGSEEFFDLVIDARGFPKELTAAHVRFPVIPTNSALLRRGPVAKFRTATRAVARPHGWIFVIPLTMYSSYGYVHNRSLTTNEELEADFNAFFDAEQIDIPKEQRFIQFPNFARRSFFDGTCFTIGNSASFFEPLEATAITIILFELKMISLWLAQRLLGADQPSPASMDKILLDFVTEVGLFVGWHYAAGSHYDTPFWAYAKKSFERGIKSFEVGPIHSSFYQFVEEGFRLPEELAFREDRGKVDDLKSHPYTGRTFGGFHVESFAKVGHGIGYYT